MTKSTSVLILSLALTASMLTGCMLDTRSQVKEQDEKAVLRKSVQNLQATTADVNSRFADVEEDVRKANGRIEALETRQQRADAAMNDRAGKASAQLDAKLGDNDKAYREEFTKLRQELDALKAQISSGQAEKAAEKAAATASAKDPFASAETKFESKNYQGALGDYKTYREKNPSGKHYPTATYKMGVSFQELGMIDEARSFYEEVTSTFPKSKEAKSAAAKLKSLKKKK